MSRFKLYSLVSLASLVNTINVHFEMLRVRRLGAKPMRYIQQVGV